MKVMKKTNGYSIEVSHDEYDDILDAIDAGAIWHDENGNMEDAAKCRAMYEDLEAVKHRYLTDEEAAPIVNCLCCKNCLPPYLRKNGMCRLDKCKFDPA